jgi:hypothetical protein
MFFNSSETVVVGAGGAGGAAQTVDNTNGNIGIAGGPTSFGKLAPNLSMVVANGGANGSVASYIRGGIVSGYTTTTSTIYASGIGQKQSGTSPEPVGKASTSLYPVIASSSGGGGGGADSVTERSGGVGGSIVSLDLAVLLAGGAGGLESTGING